MAFNSKIDMSLDEIIKIEGIRPFASKRINNNNNPNNRRRNFRNADRNNFGVRKSFGSRNNFQRFNDNRRSFSDRPNGMNRLNRNSNKNERFRSSKPATLHVSNLAMTVTSEDLDELFSSFGNLRRAFVHYDQLGNSIGTAEIEFERRDEAFEAQQKLNNVPLDRRPLRITLIDESYDDPFTASLKSSTFSNNRYNNNRVLQNGANNDRNLARNNRSGRYNQNNKNRLSASDLDRELDEWRKQSEIEEKKTDDISTPMEMVS
ncbi:HMG box transcription factor BBX [Sarcoptes scabiei]|nr:HMG box transcription factor BBX [Sarcoptes scabiei]